MNVTNIKFKKCAPPIFVRSFYCDTSRYFTSACGKQPPNSFSIVSPIQKNLNNIWFFCVQILVLFTYGITLGENCVFDQWIDHVGGRRLLYVFFGVFCSIPFCFYFLSQWPQIWHNIILVRFSDCDAMYQKFCKTLWRHMWKAPFNCSKSVPFCICL